MSNAILADSANLPLGNGVDAPRIRTLPGVTVAEDIEPADALAKTGMQIVPATATLALGADSIVGSYRIVNRIGCGGMGEVFEAVHTMLPRHVAIKVLHSKLRRNPAMDARMVQEAELLDELHHPGVARVFDCGLLADLRPWIAMELVAGESLATKLDRETTLLPVEVCNLVAAVADVLATVHTRGIVHRDLKPDNVLFEHTEGGFPVRVIDWGVAHIASASRLTLDGETCGTPTYMSPEQAYGRDIGPPCDIYSLGVIAYEALSGQPPFSGQSLGAVVSLHLHGDAAPLSAQCPAAPQTLCDLIHHMLQKDPSLRPTAEEVRQVMQMLSIEIANPNPEFESYELTSATSIAPRIPQAVAIELGAPDDPALELPAIPRPRWTPEMAAIPTASSYLLIRPQGTHCHVSGEILPKH